MGLLVFYGKLQWVGGPGRLDTSYEFIFELDVPRVTGSILIDSRPRRRLGRLRQRAQPHRAAGARCSATTRWPTSAG